MEAKRMIGLSYLLYFGKEPVKLWICRCCSTVCVLSPNSLTLGLFRTRFCILSDITQGDRFVLSVLTVIEVQVLNSGSDFNHCCQTRKKVKTVRCNKVGQLKISTVSARVPISLLFLRCSLTEFALNKKG